jgi:hypothetical protein
MPRTANALVATSVEALTRSLLFTLGVDHALIDFLVRIAIGALALPGLFPTAHSSTTTSPP